MKAMELAVAKRIVVAKSPFHSLTWVHTFEKLNPHELGCGFFLCCRCHVVPPVVKFDLFETLKHVTPC
jgi:hypothetical protein